MSKRMNLPVDVSFRGHLLAAKGNIASNRSLTANTDMLSYIFGKRKSSVEDDTPPIPGPRAEDGFVVVDPSSPSSGIYPNVSGSTFPPIPPARPAPPAPRIVRAESTFHYLQGVPFTLCRELQMASNKDALATEITDQLAFMTSKINMNSFDYDFSVERSILKEY